MFGIIFRKNKMKELLRYKEDLNLIFWDVETFNLNLSFQFNRFWQVGLLKVNGNKEIDNKDLYVNWPNCNLKISADAARVTKYSQEKFDQRAINENIAFNETYEWMENCEYAIGHNILGFDLYLLIEWYKMHSKEWKHLPYKMIDTNCLAKAVKMNIPFKKGDNLLEWQYKLYHKIQKGIKTNQTLLGKEWDLKFDENNLHDALNDLRLTLQIWNKVKYLIEV